MSGIYDEIINLCQEMGDAITGVYDFSKVDHSTGLVQNLSLATAKMPDATIQGINPQKVGHTGYEFDGVTHSPVYLGDNSVLHAPLVIATIKEHLSTEPLRRMHAGSATNHVNSIIVGADGKAKVRNTWNSFTVTATNALPLDKMVILSSGADRGSYAEVISGEIGDLKYIRLTRNPLSPETVKNYVGGGTFKGIIGLVIFKTGNLSVAEYDGISARLDLIGSVQIETTLPAEPNKSVAIVNEAAQIIGSAAIPAGQTIMDAYITAKNGTNIQFAAFDDSAGFLMYKTPRATLTGLTVLEFTPVTEGGGDTGGEGTAEISGNVSIDGTASERPVIVIADDQAGRKVVGEGVSNPDGTFNIQYNGWDGSVIALALDHYGADWTAEKPTNAGTIIHPTTPNGFVYEASTGGTTGITEPVWATDGTTATPDGSVSWVPKPYYRPIASGPIKGNPTPP